MRRQAIILVFYVCAITLVPAADLCAQQEKAAPEISQDDLIHFGDVIDVDFVGDFAYDWRGTINPEGFLEGLREYGDPIYALCRTEKAIAEDVAKAYGRILRSPRVEVRIIDRSNRPLVRLDGAVKTPSRFRLRRKTHIRELLVLAGGLTDAASGEISVLRPANLSCRRVTAESGRRDNELQVVNIKISDLIRGKAEADVEIVSGDIINVVKASPVYVMGAVNNPRPIYSPSEITLSRAIDMSGGVSKDADGGKVTIFRRSGGESRVISTDLEQIKISKTGDEILKPFDIIEVAAKGAPKRKFPPLPVAGNSSDASRPELPLRVVD